MGHWKHEWAYDENGFITAKIEYEWNSETNEWTSTSKQFAFWSELSTRIYSRVEHQKCVIYPNPVISILKIETENADHYSIRITALNGRLIRSEEMEGTTHQFDLSSFQKGVYFITIRSKDFVTTRKIIKL